MVSVFIAVFPSILIALLFPCSCFVSWSHPFLACSVLSALTCVVLPDGPRFAFSTFSRFGLFIS
jgi:hypothetical protein